MRLDSIGNYDQLTTNEKKVLGFILDHLPQIPLMNINEVAKANFLSKTVVINLCHKLGFSGFKELKFSISNQLREKSQKESSMRQYRYEVKDNLEKTFALISDDMIEKCAAVMHKSNNIFIMARGTSIAVGYYMQHLLFSIDHHCIFISDYNLAEAFVNLAQVDDCIIFISLSGITQKVVDTAQRFNLKGCDMITITGFHNNTLANMTGNNLYTYTKENPKKSEKQDPHSRLGFFLVTELLVEEFRKLKEE